MKSRLIQHLATAVVLSSALTLASSCVDARGRVYVRLGPPAPIVDVRGAAPGPDFVWIDGYHHWNGNAYEWTAGRWERRPRAGARWEAGHWAHDGHGWYFVEGRWR